MTTSTITLDWPACTYLDSADAYTDHSGLPSAPMLADTTALLLAFGLATDDDETAGSGVLTVTAATDFDGTVTLSLSRAAAAWSTGAVWADLPDATGTAVTWTGTLSAGDTATFDVTAMIQAAIDDPSTAFGWILTRTDSGTEGTLAMTAAPSATDGSSMRPSLSVDLSQAPDAPTQLSPRGSLAAGSSKPILTGVSEAAITALQVQIATDLTGWTETDGWTSPTFDSGEVAATTPAYDLEGSTGFLGFGATDKPWSMRIKGVDGVWSKWQTPAWFHFTSKPSAVDTSGAYCGDPQPTYSGSLSTGTIAQWRWVTTAADGSLWDDSGWQAGSDPTYSPINTDGSAKVLPDSSAMTRTLMLRDTVDRIASPGLPVYATTSMTFAHADDQTIDPPDSVLAVQRGSSPWVDVFVTLQAAPLAMIVVLDGVHVGRYRPRDLDPPDDSEGSLVYRVPLYFVRPSVEHTVGVKRVHNGHTSGATSYIMSAFEPTGCWFVDMDSDTDTVLIDNDLQGSVTDQVGIDVAQGDQYARAVRTATGRPNGSAMTGACVELDGFTAEYWVKRLRDIADNAKHVQMAYGDVSVPVAITNVDYWTPLNGDLFRKQVSLNVSQTGPGHLWPEPGAPVSNVTTYDFEEGADGDAIAAWDEPTKTGSPGVVQVRGTGAVYRAGSAKHGAIGYDNGADGSSLVYAIDDPAAEQVYLRFKAAGTYSGNAVTLALLDANKDRILQWGPRTTGISVIEDTESNTLALSTGKVTFSADDDDDDAWIRVSQSTTYDATDESLTWVLRIAYNGGEGLAYGDILTGVLTTGAAIPAFIAIGCQSGNQRHDTDSVSIADNAADILLPLAPNDTPTFYLGIAGGPTTTGAVTKIRLDHDLDVGKSIDLAVSTSADMSSPTMVGAQTVADDGSVTHMITGLSAGTRYYCQGYYGAAPFGEVFSFVTCPATTGDWSERWLLGSCLGNFAQGKTPDVAIRDALNQTAFDRHLFLGDVYWGQSIDWRDSYLRDVDHYTNWFSLFSSWRQLWQSCGLLSVCSSDHNQTINGDGYPSNGYDPNSKTGPQHIFGAMEPVREMLAFQAMWPVRQYGDTKTVKTWRGYYVDLHPKLRVISVDMRTQERSNADDTDGPDKDLLGAEQSHWLFYEAMNFDGMIVLVHETSYWRKGAALRATDKPAAYPDWQDRLVARLNATGEFADMTPCLARFLWLGGDRHYCGVVTADDADDGFAQIIGSGWQKNGLALQDNEIMTWTTPVPDSAHDDKVAVAQYMVIAVSWDESASTFTFSARARYCADTSGDPSGWVMSDLPSDDDGGATDLVFTL